MGIPFGREEDIAGGEARRDAEAEVEGEEGEEGENVWMVVAEG